MSVPEVTTSDLLLAHHPILCPGNDKCSTATFLKRIQSWKYIFYNSKCYDLESREVWCIHEARGCVSMPWLDPSENRTPNEAFLSLPCNDLDPFACISEAVKESGKARSQPQTSGFRSTQLWTIPGKRWDCKLPPGKQAGRCRQQHGLSEKASNEAKWS